MNTSRENYSEELEKQYRQMERAHDSIVEELESKTRSKGSVEMLDTVNSFFVMCYHLREWIKEDGKVSVDAKNALPTFEKGNSPVQFLICRDLANKSKHATLKKGIRHKPNDVNTKIEAVGGSVFMVHKDEIKEAGSRKETIHLKDEDAIFLGNFVVSFRGDRYDLKGVVQSCMHEWKKYFDENDLLLPRYTPYQKNN